jgi:hypothetical protein
VVSLINWLWLEDLLVRAAEAEIRQFGRAHPHESFFAFCLEFDGLTGQLHFSYGTRAAVDGALHTLRDEADDGAVYYRSVELRPENWGYHRVPPADPEGYWRRAQPIFERYREAMGEDQEPGVAEFLWLRFDYLAECVVRALIDRQAFYPLAQEAEFIAYSANEHEGDEELEDRIARLFPRYQRATVELVNQPRPADFLNPLWSGETVPRRCHGEECRRKVKTGELYRCTCCHQWFCEPCAGLHTHPELFDRQPLFSPGGA